MPRGTPEGGAVHTTPKSATLGIAIPCWVPPAGASAGGAQAAPLQGQQQLGQGPCVRGYEVPAGCHTHPTHSCHRMLGFTGQNETPRRALVQGVAQSALRHGQQEERPSCWSRYQGFVRGVLPWAFSDRHLLRPAPLRSSYFTFMCGGERILLKQQNPEETSASISKPTQRTVFI